MTHEQKQAAKVLAAVIGLYLLSGRRWSDEGRLRRWLKGK